MFIDFLHFYAHARTKRARARAFYKIFIYDKVINLTNNLILETPHLSKIYGLKRLMPQVIKEKKRVVLTTTIYRSIILCSTICILICNNYSQNVSLTY